MMASDTVSVERGGKTLPIKAGMPIEERDRITTGARGRVTVGFADHAQMTIGDRTVVVVEQSGAAVHPHITLISGIVRSITEASKSVFEVTTSNAATIAREGKTDISFYQQARRRGFPSCDHFTDVAVLEGAAQVKGNAAEDNVTVPSGYVSTVACTSAPTGAGPLGIADARTLNESNGGSGGFLYTFFHNSSPGVEQEDIDGVPDADDRPPMLPFRQVPLTRSPSAIRMRPPMTRGPIRLGR